MNTLPATPNDEHSPDKKLAARQSIVAPLLTALSVLLVGFVAWRLLASSTKVTIGVEGKQLVTIAGPRLYAAPFTPGDAISLRIADAQPTAHGFGYDLRYIPYGPGQHDLSQQLMLAGNARPEKLPKLMISVSSILPNNHQGELFDTGTSPIDLHSNYSLWMGISWVLWMGLLIPLILLGRAHHVRAAPPMRVPSLRERLEDLLVKASRTPLNDVQQADLEQLLMGYWAQRLNLSDERLTHTLEHLKQHPTAGRQIMLVEKWLHRRGKPGDTSVARELLAELATDLRSNADVAMEGSTS